VPSVAVLLGLDRNLQHAVRQLAMSLAARFGAPPLNDHALTQLPEKGPSLRHIVVDGPDVVGYAQVELDGIVDAHVAADSPHVATLLEATERLAAGRPVRVWAHGQHSPLGPELAGRGYHKTRVLWQLRRPLQGLTAANPPADVTIRAFIPGQDEAAWLAVNAAAFAVHPEQGRWTLHDLQLREAEPWFDPAGFLLADRAGELLGFHWTKIHGEGLGEVYVLGVSPHAQGMHLGRELLAAGLQHLADRGCAQVLLYVDDTNTAALRLYDSVGFHRYDLDVQYERDALA
jgi:mycothiol synthase